MNSQIKKSLFHFLKAFIPVFVFALPAFGFPPLEPPAPIKRLPLPMTIDQAKASLGFAASPENTGLINKRVKIKFAIIDTGFEGIDPWLEDHPEEKKVTSYISVTRSGKKIPGNHGYYAYRVARKILPHAHLYLLDKGQTNADMAKALQTMVKNDVFMGSFSQGSSLYLGQPQQKLRTGKTQILDMLNHYEITLFQAVGNDRAKVHFFPYLDQNKDNILEFGPQAKTKQKADRNRIIMFEQHEVTLELFWNEFPKKKSNFIVQLVDRTGKLITQADSLDSKIPRIRLTYLPREKQLADIKILAKKAVNPKNLRFSLYANQANLEKGIFNGFERTAALSKFESPFLISVGSYGRDKNNTPAPSAFSSHGQTVDGDVIPHILGPGQLKLEEKKRIEGTSYSTPFLAALYGSCADYNIKNMIQASASHAPLKPGLSKAEASRWGVPDLEKINNNPCRDSDQITHLSHKITKNGVSLKFQFSRKCMQGLSYYPTVTLKSEAMSGKTKKLTHLKRKDNPQKKLSFFAAYKSRERNIENQTIEIKMPFKHFKKEYFGKDIIPVFYLRTRAQWDPVPITNQPNYRFQLPVLNNLE